MLDIGMIIIILLSIINTAIGADQVSKYSLMVWQSIALVWVINCTLNK